MAHGVDINTVLLESRHWGAAREVTNEYKTYSESQVKVYKDDKLITTTDTGVRTYQLFEILFTKLYRRFVVYGRGSIGEKFTHRSHQRI